MRRTPTWKKQLAVFFTVIALLLSLAAVSALGDEAQFDVTPTELQIGQQVCVTLDCPGASRCYVAARNANDDLVWEEYCDGASAVYYFTQDASGVYTIRGEAYDEASEGWTLCGETQVTFTSNGQLAAPTITAPESYRLGDALTIQVGDVAHADDFHLVVYERDSLRQMENHGIAPGEVTLRTNDLRYGVTYVIRVSVTGTGEGYDGTSAEETFVVTADRDANLSITIDKTEPLLHTDFSVTVHAPGATFVRLYETTEGRTCDFWPDDSGDYINRTEGWGLDFEGATQIYARACYDALPDGGYDPNELTYGGISNIIQVSPQQTGHATAPTITVPDEIAWGELLPVTIHLEEDEPLLMLSIYGADQENDNVHFYGWRCNAAMTGDTTVYLPTSFLEAGHRYQLLASASGAGKDWADNAPGSAVFTVTDGEGDQSSCLITPAALLMDHSVWASAFIPGATNVRTSYQDLENGNSWGNGNGWDEEHSALSVFERLPEPHDYLVRVEASYDHEESWTLIGEAQVNVYSNGVLDAPVIDADNVIQSGEDLVISVGEVAHADEYYLTLFERDGENNPVVLWRPIKPGETIVSAELLRPGYSYDVCVNVNGRRDGYESRDASVPVYVCGEQDENLQLTVSTTQPLAHEDLQLVAHAPGASHVRVYNSSNPEDHNDLFEHDEDGNFYGEWNFEWPVILYARASYDDVGEEGYDPDSLTYGLPSNAVSILPVRLGESTAPIIRTPETVALGELLPVVIQPQNGETMFNISILGMDEDTRDRDFFSDAFRPGSDEELTVFLGTSELEPGRHYRVQVNAARPGYAWTGTSETEGLFTVTEGDANAVRLAVMPAEVLVGSEVTAFVSAPGHTDLLLLWQRPNGERMSENWLNNWFEKASWSPWESGDYQVVARISYDSGETWMTTDPVSFTATSLGQMDAPEVTMPDLLQEGEDLTIQVQPVENAQRYELFIEDCRDWAWSECFDIEPDEIVIPADRLQARYSYQVSVTAYANGYDPCTTTKWVLVCGEQDENITLTVSNDEPMVYEDFEITVSAPGATFVRVYESGVGNGCYDIWPDDEGYDLRTISWSCWTSIPVRYFYAVACYDELPDEIDPNELAFQGMSSLVQVRVQCIGQGNKPDIEVPDEIALGEIATVNVTLHDDDMVHVSVRSAEDDNYGQEYYARSYAFGSDGVKNIRIPMTFLEEGRRYRVEARAFSQGKTETSTYENEGLFTAVAGANELRFDVSPERVQVGEPITSIMIAPGATQLYVQWYRASGECLIDSWGEINDECPSMTAIDTFYESDVYEAHALYSYDDGLSWGCAGIRQVTVTSLGKLNAPAVDVPAAIDAGEDLTFTVGAADNAEELTVYVCDLENEDEALMDGPIEPGEFTIPADSLIPGHCYRVGAYVSAAGYDWSGTEKIVIVRDAIDETLTISVTNTEPMTNEPFSVIINAPGATFVRLYRTSDPFDIIDVWPDGQGYVDHEVHCSRWISESFSYYARACYDELPEEFDPNELTLSGISNLVPVRVQANGTGSQPVLEVQGTVVRGELLQVTVDLQNGDDLFDVRIYDNDTSEEIYFRNYVPGATGCYTVNVPTANLDPERPYCICVATGGIGKDWVFTPWTIGRFVVTEPEQEIVFEVDPAEVMIYDDVNIYIGAPGACNGKAVWYDDSGEIVWETENCWEDQYMDIQHRVEDTGVFTIFAEVTWDGENWQRCEEPVTVVVTANGSLDEPVIHLPALAYAGTDLTFQVDAVPQAESYSCELRDAETGDILGEWRDLTSAGDWTLPGDLLQTGRYLDVRVHAYATEARLTPSQATARLYVRDALDQNLTISADRTEGLINDLVTFTINAPGASFVRLYRLNDPDDCLDVWTDTGYDDCVVEWEIGKSSWYYARACYDELPEGDELDPGLLAYGDMSNMVWIESTILGEAGLPGVSAPDSVAWGDPLPVTITPTGEGYWYDAHVERWENGEPVEDIYWERFEHEDQSPFVAELPTFRLGIGESYGVRFSAAAPGYTWADSWDNTSFFTITENDQSFFRATPAEAWLHDDVQLVIGAPGSTRAKMTLTCDTDGSRQENLFDEPCEYYEWVSSFDQQGVYTAVGEVCYDEDGENWETVDVITFTISALGQLDKPVAHVPMTVTTGEPLVLSVEPVEHADWLLLWIERDGERIWEEFFENAAQEVTVPADVLPTDMAFCINIYAAAEKYSSSMISVLVCCVDEEEPSGRVTLTLETEGTLYANDELTLRVTAPGAVCAYVYDKIDPWWQQSIDLDGGAADSTLFTLRMDGDRHYFVVKALYGPMDENWDPETAAYELSNVVTIEQISYGDVAVPDYRVESSTVSRGDPLTVTILPSENSSCYRLIIKEGDMWYSDTTVRRDDRAPFTVELPTWMLETGKEYTVEIFASGRGYNTTSVLSAQSTFTVTDIALPVLRLPAALTEVGGEAFAGSDARMIVVPEGVTYIGSRAFADCTALVFVKIPDTVEGFSDDAFEGCSGVVFITSPQSPAACFAYGHGIEVVER